MTRTEVPVVRKQVVVNAPVEQAFTAFTERFGAFKPPEHNLLGRGVDHHLLADNGDLGSGHGLSSVACSATST